MNGQKIAVITPSYWADFELASRLSESMDYYFKFEFIHYLIVSKKDYNIFKRLGAPHRKIICAEDILRPYGFKKIPLPRRIRVPFWGEKRYREQWYLRGAGRVGGWTVQQIIKLSASDYCTADTLVFADSDIEIIRDVTADRFIRNGQVLLHEHGDVAANPRSSAWRAFALALLGLPANADRGLSYVGNLIVWDRKTLLELRSLLAQKHGKWWRYLAKENNISEYIIYGTYVRNLTDGKNHHIGDHRLYCSIWDQDHLDHGLKLDDANVAIHLQSVLKIDDRERESIINSIKTENNIPLRQKVAQ